MKLREILENLNDLSNELIIYAEKNPQWSADSRAVTVSEHDEIMLGKFEYFLEVDLAKEVLEVWSKWRKGLKPSIEDICKATIYYAEYDAYLPVEE